MTTERFIQLLNGPLHHPMPMFALTRLALALRAVVDATGKTGEEALEKHCADREAQDNNNWDNWEEQRVQDEEED